MATDEPAIGGSACRDWHAGPAGSSRCPAT